MAIAFLCENAVEAIYISLFSVHVPLWYPLDCKLHLKCVTKPKLHNLIIRFLHYKMFQLEKVEWKMGKLQLISSRITTWLIFYKVVQTFCGPQIAYEVGTIWHMMPWHYAPKKQHLVRKTAVLIICTRIRDPRITRLIFYEVVR